MIKLYRKAGTVVGTTASAALIGLAALTAQVGISSQATAFLALAAWGAASSPAYSETGVRPRYRPRELTWDEVRQRGKKPLKELFDIAENIPLTGLGKIDDKTKAFKEKMRIARYMAEYLDFIDPREAAVHPDYSPSDMPMLPSRCGDNPSVDCGSCYSSAQTDLNKWRVLLEDLFVIYKKTMFEVERLTALGDAAASMSGIAKLVWTMRRPELAAKQKFFSVYDTNFEKLMRRTNNAVANIAECERKFFADYGWYYRYGLPFYLYIRDRYRRPK